MVDQIIFGLTAVLLTEAVAHAVKNWGILDRPRNWLTSRSVFLRSLLSCFECVSVWTAALVLTYLYCVDFWPIPFIIVTARLAALLHIVADYVDALRAGALTRI